MPEIAMNLSRTPWDDPLVVSSYHENRTFCFLLYSKLNRLDAAGTAPNDNDTFPFQVNII